MFVFVLPAEYVGGLHLHPLHGTPHLSGGSGRSQARSGAPLGREVPGGHPVGEPPQLDPAALQVGPNFSIDTLQII